ncbi:hypothetical protein, partial [Pseudomonas aeruginosa]|uniref:hypothetical protein n=1 Tax=Pseudomonas aeruginosa TaxID=287 RepID=UPI001F4436B3
GEDVTIGGFEDRRPILILFVVVFGHEWFLPVPGSTQWDFSTRMVDPASKFGAADATRDGRPLPSRHTLFTTLRLKLANHSSKSATPA